MYANNVCSFYFQRQSEFNNFSNIKFKGMLNISGFIAHIQSISGERRGIYLDVMQSFNVLKKDKAKK